MKLARKFKIKTAQDPFDSKVFEFFKELDDKESHDPFGDPITPPPKTRNQSVLEELNTKYQDFKDSIANDKVIDGQYEWSYDPDKVMYDRRIRSLMYNITKNVVTPDEVEDELNKINTLEFTIEQKDQAQFLAKEKSDIKAEQDAASAAISGKTTFNQQDASKIINPSLARIKAEAVKIKATGQVNFIFYSNGSVGVSCTNVALSNLIRKKFVLEFQLELRQYITNYKKYFATPSVTFTTSI